MTRRMGIKQVERVAAVLGLNATESRSGFEISRSGENTYIMFDDGREAIQAMRHWHAFGYRPGMLLEDWA